MRCRGFGHRFVELATISVCVESLEKPNEVVDFGIARTEFQAVRLPFYKFQIGGSFYSSPLVACERLVHHTVKFILGEWCLINEVFLELQESCGVMITNQLSAHLVDCFGIMPVDRLAHSLHRKLTSNRSVHKINIIVGCSGRVS